MNRSKMMVVWLALAFLLTACTAKPADSLPTVTTEENIFVPVQTEPVSSGEAATQIVLSDSGITVDGSPISTDNAAAVYTANDIVYYESGKDFTYGEGSEEDAHTPQEAAAHTVVHIAKSGTYSISGKLTLGQIAVDLGDGAKKDPEAVVTLILDGVDIGCQVAPAVIFYNVYECGNDDTETATKDVDTSAAGANVIVADGTINNISGSYVARIYKPDSVVLNKSKTAVEDADKLHKYDGAFYSKRSMNIFGGEENTGILNIKAENEGLDSEMHLTINGGSIHIESGNDGINTNEDGVSVTTVNGGELFIKVTGETGEGDGIDSNGWLVINGGTVVAAACSSSADAGIDSDMGIHVNGGTVIASGHMLDRIEDGGQNYAVFNFAQKQKGSETVTMKNQNGDVVLETKPENAYSVLIFSSSELKIGTYTLWSDGKQLSGSSGGFEMGPGGMGPGGMGPGGMGPGGMGNADRPDNMQPPEEGQMPPEGGTSPGGFMPPEGEAPPEMQGGDRPGNYGTDDMDMQMQTKDFTIRDGGNMFSVVS